MFFDLYLILATVAFGLLYVKWSKHRWYDFLIKTFMFLMTIWGVLKLFGVTA